MNVREILEAYRSGKITPEDAERMLRTDYIERIGDDVLFDTGRQIRKDVPEVVYALGKTPESVAAIASKTESLLLISRASNEHFEAVKKVRKDAEYHKSCGIIILGKMPESTFGPIAIVTAGTSDVPYAEEARIMAEAMGCKCITFYDIGVAGVHRILDPMKTIIAENADAIVAVAGMEGALPTIISSLSPVPVIGLPTSTGYGMGGKGEAALLSMLQSCSPGLSVVNIDNGIGAGSFAALIARRARKE